MLTGSRSMASRHAMSSGTLLKTMRCRHTSASLTTEQNGTERNGTEQDTKQNTHARSVPAPRISDRRPPRKTQPTLRGCDCMRPSSSCRRASELDENASECSRAHQGGARRRGGST
eukprot:2284685-Rhodomonas_salina.2